MSESGSPRGVMCCNPGNIDRTADHWVGMADVQDDPRFVVFTAPQWGIRAMAKILTKHYNAGMTTIRSLISSWAPGNENDTDAYIADVSRRMGTDPDVNLVFPDDLSMLVKGIIWHENGQQPYPDSLISLGIQLAEHV